MYFNRQILENYIQSWLAVRARPTVLHASLGFRAETNVPFKGFKEAKGIATSILSIQGVAFCKLIINSDTILNPKIPFDSFLDPLYGD